MSAEPVAIPLATRDQIDLFAKSLELSPKQKNDRDETIRRVQDLFSEINCEVVPFGSYMVGTSFPDSDIDLSVIAGSGAVPLCDDAFVKKAMSDERKRRRLLMIPALFPSFELIQRNQGTLFSKIKLIPATVPIISCKFMQTGVAMDVVFKQDGLATSEFMLKQCKTHPEAPPLIRLFKCLLHHRKLHDPSQGGVGGTVAALMVLFYLKQAKAIGVAVGEHFVEFLRFWTTFDFRTQTIHAATWTVSIKKEPPNNKLSILHPIDKQRNTAKACKQFARKVIPAMLEAVTDLVTVPVHDPRQALIRVFGPAAGCATAGGVATPASAVPAAAPAVAAAVPVTVSPAPPAAGCVAAGVVTPASAVPAAPPAVAAAVPVTVSPAAGVATPASAVPAAPPVAAPAQQVVPLAPLVATPGHATSVAAAAASSTIAVIRLPAVATRSASPKTSQPRHPNEVPPKAINRVAFSLWWNRKHRPRAPAQPYELRPEGSLWKCEIKAMGVVVAVSMGPRKSVAKEIAAEKVMSLLSSNNRLFDAASTETAS